MCRLSWNLGASTSWNPQGLSRPVMGLRYLIFFTIKVFWIKCWLEVCEYLEGPVNGHQSTCANDTAYPFIKTLLPSYHTTLSHCSKVFCFVLIVSERQAAGACKIPNQVAIFLLRDQRVSSSSASYSTVFFHSLSHFHGLEYYVDKRTCWSRGLARLSKLFVLLALLVSIIFRELLGHSPK